MEYLEIRFFPIPAISRIILHPWLAPQNYAIMLSWAIADLRTRGYHCLTLACTKIYLNNILVQNPPQDSPIIA